MPPPSRTTRCLNLVKNSCLSLSGISVPPSSDDGAILIGGGERSDSSSATTTVDDSRDGCTLEDGGTRNRDLSLPSILVSSGRGNSFSSVGAVVVVVEVEEANVIESSRPPVYLMDWMHRPEGV